MSASKRDGISDEKSENTKENSKLNGQYALYLLSNKKHACASDNDKEATCLSPASDSSESAEPLFYLSLLDGNLNAELETAVRCYLLKSLPPDDTLALENDGKYTVLKVSDSSEESIDCYYHKLSKNFDSATKEENSSEAKFHTFFICLIRPSNGVMESFCSELGIFCQNFLPLLDPEGMKAEDALQVGGSKLQLQSWYYYCIEYISRCVRNFSDQLTQVLHCSLWGNVKIISSDEETLWDLERVVDVCSLMSKCTDSKVNKDSDHLILEVDDKKFVINKELGSSEYCTKWFEKLKNCQNEDHSNLRSILESFRLKAIQDLNTLKRILKKAVLDHYALYRAYQFLKNSGYPDVLLFHVKQEAATAEEMEMVDVINCLQDFLKSNPY